MDYWSMKKEAEAQRAKEDYERTIIIADIKKEDEIRRKSIAEQKEKISRFQEQKEQLLSNLNLVG
jgi:hypothetical protein